jgi:energy-converting hydrogenase A subunit M
VLPNDVKHLNKAVRESYIELFSQDILKDWTEQLGVEFDESVMINTLDLQGVSNSSYIFS